MTELAGVTGLVLAGGGSRRMGRDKAALVYAGERLVDRAVRILAVACDEVLVASGDGCRLDVPVRQVPDLVEDAGPLAGIAAGLAVASSPVVAVVAVDAPFPDVAVLRLCTDGIGAAAVCLPQVDGVLQPLHAVWATSAASEVAAELAAGERSPRRVAPRLGAVVLPEAEWGPVAVAGGRFAASWNRPEDVTGSVPSV